MSRQSIKSAIIFKAELPSAEALSKHLSECLFTDILESHYFSCGFIPNIVTNEVVTPIEGGFLLSYRIDEKILPKSVIARELYDRSQKLQDEGIEFDAMALKETTCAELLKRAFVKSTHVLALYSEKDQFLVVATSRKHHASMVISSLVKACGSVKTETIHIDGVSKGVTARLDNMLNDKDSGDCFGDNLEVGSFFLLERKLDKKKEVVKYDTDFYSVRGELEESLNNNFNVSMIELSTGDITFKLTDNFTFKGIKPVSKMEFDDKDRVFRYRHECALMLFYTSNAINILIDLLKYKEK
ncbi:recombination-associated protein RdgC [Morganella morganii]|uniref:recombination-associated protein RdgC n=1 Tax=Morganella morganii TaxID=582 RepID=UPI002368C029|nr:recombination-associated protein RdgC [Morganella morganii]